MKDNYLGNFEFGGRRSGLDRRVFNDPGYDGMERRITGDRRRKLRHRRYPRFKAKDLTFVKLNDEYKEDIGQLLDICRDGLSVRYFVSEKHERTYSDLGIFVHGGDFSIDWIPFRTVSETELANKSPFSIITFRRYGVQFEKLTPEQADKLEYFLLNHTVGID